VLDEESINGKIEKSLIGVNAGVGSDMRIYFKQRKPSRFVTIGQPDMKMYPPEMLPADEKQLPGFEWKDRIRPQNRDDVFRKVTK